MFINIDPSSGLPNYLQIVQQIKTAVAMGRLQPEEPLPSVRHLAVELAVNLVLHAEESLKFKVRKFKVKDESSGPRMASETLNFSTLNFELKSA